MGLYVKTDFPKSLLKKAICTTVLNIGVLSTASEELTVDEVSG